MTGGKVAAESPGGCSPNQRCPSCHTKPTVLFRGAALGKTDTVAAERRLFQEGQDEGAPLSLLVGFCASRLSLAVTTRNEMLSILLDNMMADLHC